TGHCTEALQLADASLSGARAIDVTQHPAVIHAHLAAALVHLHRADFDRAAEHVDMADLQNLRRPSNVVNLDLQRALAAQLRAAAGDSEGALAVGDTSTAMAVLQANQAPVDDLRAAVGNRLREAATLEARGERASAQAAIRLAVAAAEGDQLRWPFQEVAGARQVLRHDTSNPAHFAADLRELLESRAAPTPSRREPAIGPGMVEPLTERELAVLSYLPQRIKQRDIAAELYITMNTLKTHVASIYRKLGVCDRDEAATRAAELGLL
ncbi:MAG: LuxR C-terminal-related transcriptional regulator, partial [Dermatophilaceae bacterium]